MGDNGRHVVVGEVVDHEQQHEADEPSLTFALVLFVIYELYTSNMGEISREYLSQVLTVAIVAFLVWRAETLQELESSGYYFRGKNLAFRSLIRIFAP